MKNVVISASPITGDIYAGKINKAKTMWVGEKQDVTEDAIRAVFDSMAIASKQDNDATVNYTYPSKDGTLTYTPTPKELH